MAVPKAYTCNSKPMSLLNTGSRKERPGPCLSSILHSNLFCQYRACCPGLSRHNAEMLNERMKAFSIFLNKHSSPIIFKELLGLCWLPCLKFLFIFFIFFEHQQLYLNSPILSYLPRNLAPSIGLFHHASYSSPLVRTEVNFILPFLVSLFSLV